MRQIAPLPDDAMSLYCFRCAKAQLTVVGGIIHECTSEVKNELRSEGLIKTSNNSLDYSGEIVAFRKEFGQG